MALTILNGCEVSELQEKIAALPGQTTSYIQYKVGVLVKSFKDEKFDELSQKIDDVLNLPDILPDEEGPKNPLNDFTFFNPLSKEAVSKKAQETTPELEQVNNSKPFSYPRLTGDYVDDDAYLGSTVAPVVMIQFGDFRCPFCKRFHEEVFPKIKENYIDTGLVKFIYRDFPFHKNSALAAIAAECVKSKKDSSGYYAFHDKIFKNQSNIGEVNLIKWAGQIGVDEDFMKTCLKDTKMKDEVQDDFNEGQTIGVEGTPTFLVNNYLVSGVKTFYDFKTIFDYEISNNKK